MFLDASISGFILKETPKQCIPSIGSSYAKLVHMDAHSYQFPMHQKIRSVM